MDDPVTPLALHDEKRRVSSVRQSKGRHREVSKSVQTQFHNASALQGKSLFETIDGQLSFNNDIEGFKE